MTTASPTTDATLVTRRITRLDTSSSNPPGNDGRWTISRLTVYVVLLSGLALGLLTWLLAVGRADVPAMETALVALVAALAERSRVRLTANSEISISLVPIVFAAVSLGPVPAALVGAAAMLGDFRRPLMRWAVYSASGAITGTVASLAAGLAGGGIDSRTGAIALSTMVAAFVAQTADLGFAMLTLAVRGTGRPQTLLRTVGPIMPLAGILAVALVAPLSLGYEAATPWVLVFFLVPVVALQRVFSMYRSQRDLAISLATAVEQQRRSNVSFASALVATLEARDKYTAGHSSAVAIYARDIAEALRLTEDETTLAHLAGLVHDIGKIGLPAAILDKPGPLTTTERAEIERHPIIGEQILSNISTYARIALIVRHHHERVDGLGYPDGVRGEEIPMLARIICVADAYNAMTSDRPYRNAMDSSVAIERLIQGAGTQFDEVVVTAFDAILRRESEQYRKGLLNQISVDLSAEFEAMSHRLAA
jgi:putative nucleotidyltransferase with HDIG domain